MDKGNNDGAERTNCDRIELHTERTRPHTDREPSWWLRHGTMTITLIFLVIAVAVMLLPYPHAEGKTLWEVIKNNIGARL